MEIAEIKPGDDERLARVLLSLQQAAYAVEASIIGDDRIPPLRETLDELRGTPLRWLGAFDDRRLVGAIARSEDHSEVDIHRLVVDPTLHRRGWAERWCRRSSLWPVAVGPSFPPGERIYRRGLCTRASASCWLTRRKSSLTCGSRGMPSPSSSAGELIDRSGSHEILRHTSGSRRPYVPAR